MELNQLTESVFYISNPTNIGVIKSTNGVILIDSGLDDDTARKILRTLKECKLKPIAIVNTHAHSDHCGGNAYLQEKMEVKIYISELEAEMAQDPYLKPLSFFSGAAPVTELKNKFLMGRASNVDNVIKEEKEEIIIDGVKLKIISLPGHALNQIGIGVDNVLFCGDSVFSKEVLEKYKIPFYTNINEQKETLQLLKESNYSCYLPAHGEPTADIIKLIETNSQVIEDIEECIVNNLNNKKTTEEVLQVVCDAQEVKMQGVQQYHLLKTTVMAYLSSLQQCDKLKLMIDDNLLYWKRE